MTIGAINPNLAYVPVVGSDQMTVGLTPSSMHADPFAVAAVPVAVVAPAFSSPSFTWIALLAFAGWYAWKKGWLTV